MSDTRLADCLRALKVLAPRNRRTADAIAAMFGFRAAPSVELSTAGAGADVGIQKPDDGESPPPGGETESRASHASVEHAVRIERRGKVRRSRLSAAWVPRAAPLHRGEPEDQLPRPPLEPLLRPNWTRAGLIAMASSRVAEGDVDVEHVIRTIASGRPVDAVPRLSGASIRRGLDILLDVSEGMTPFARDQQVFVDAAVRTIGRNDRCRVFRFAGSPDRGVWRTDFRSVPYIPVPETPVIIVTDLGLGGGVMSPTRASTSEWVQCVVQLRQSGTRAIGLIPYDQGRWPSEIRALMPLLVWDRSTNLRQIRRISWAH